MTESHSEITTFAVKFLAFWKLRPKNWGDQYIVGPHPKSWGTSLPRSPRLLRLCNTEKYALCNFAKFAPTLTVKAKQSIAEYGRRLCLFLPIKQVDLWPSDLESGVRVTCDVGYLCANYSLPIAALFSSKARCTRQTERQTSSDKSIA